MKNGISCLLKCDELPSPGNTASEVIFYIMHSCKNRLISSWVSISVVCKTEEIFILFSLTSI